MSQFPSPYKSKRLFPRKSENDTDLTRSFINSTSLSTIALNNTKIDDDLDSIVSWIDQVDSKVKTTLKNQDLEVENLKNQKRLQNLKLKYQEKIYDDEFTKLGNVLQNEDNLKPDIIDHSGFQNENVDASEEIGSVEVASEEETSEAEVEIEDGEASEEFEDDNVETDDHVDQQAHQIDQYSAVIEILSESEPELEAPAKSIHNEYEYEYEYDEEDDEPIEDEEDEYGRSYRGEADDNVHYEQNYSENYEHQVSAAEDAEEEQENEYSDYSEKQNQTNFFASNLTSRKPKLMDTPKWSQGNYYSLNDEVQEDDVNIVDDVKEGVQEDRDDEDDHEEVDVDVEDEDDEESEDIQVEYPIKTSPRNQLDTGEIDIDSISSVEIETDVEDIDDEIDGSDDEEIEKEEESISEIDDNSDDNHEKYDMSDAYLAQQALLVNQFSEYKTNSHILEPSDSINEFTDRQNDNIANAIEVSSKDTNLDEHESNEYVDSHSVISGIDTKVEQQRSHGLDELIGGTDIDLLTQNQSEYVYADDTKYTDAMDKTIDFETGTNSQNVDRSSLNMLADIVVEPINQDNAPNDFTIKPNLPPSVSNLDPINRYSDYAADNEFTDTQLTDSGPREEFGKDILRKTRKFENDSLTQHRHKMEPLHIQDNYESNLEGSLADEENEFEPLKDQLQREHKLHDVDPNDCCNPESSPVPIFKTLSAEDPKETLQKLKETEQKFNITLKSVTELEESLRISSGMSVPPSVILDTKKEYNSLNDAEHQVDQILPHEKNDFDNESPSLAFEHINETSYFETAQEPVEKVFDLEEKSLFEDDIDDDIAPNRVRAFFNQFFRKVEPNLEAEEDSIIQPEKDNKDLLEADKHEVLRHEIPNVGIIEDENISHQNQTDDESNDSGPQTQSDECSSRIMTDGGNDLSDSVEDRKLHLDQIDQESVNDRISDVQVNDDGADKIMHAINVDIITSPTTILHDIEIPVLEEISSDIITSGESSDNDEEGMEVVDSGDEKGLDMNIDATAEQHDQYTLSMGIDTTNMELDPPKSLVDEATSDNISTMVEEPSKFNDSSNFNQECNDYATYEFNFTSSQSSIQKAIRDEQSNATSKIQEASADSMSINEATSHTDRQDPRVKESILSMNNSVLEEHIYATDEDRDEELANLSQPELTGLESKAHSPVAINSMENHLVDVDKNFDGDLHENVRNREFNSSNGLVSSKLEDTIGPILAQTPVLRPILPDVDESTLIDAHDETDGNASDPSIFIESNIEIPELEDIQDTTIMETDTTRFDDSIVPESPLRDGAYRESTPNIDTSSVEDDQLVPELESEHERDDSKHIGSDNVVPDFNMQNNRMDSNQNSDCNGIDPISDANNDSTSVEAIHAGDDDLANTNSPSNNLSRIESNENDVDRTRSKAKALDDENEDDVNFANENAKIVEPDDGDFPITMYKETTYVEIEQDSVVHPSKVEEPMEIVPETEPLNNVHCHKELISELMGSPGGLDVLSPSGISEAEDTFVDGLIVSEIEILEDENMNDGVIKPTRIQTSESAEPEIAHVVSSISVTEVTENDTEYQTKQLKRKAENDGNTGFKRVKTLLGKLNPISWFSKEASVSLKLSKSVLDKTPDIEIEEPTPDDSYNESTNPSSKEEPENGISSEKFVDYEEKSNNFNILVNEELEIEMKGSLGSETDIERFDKHDALQKNADKSEYGKLETSKIGIENALETSNIEEKDEVDLIKEDSFVNNSDLDNEDEKKIEQRNDYPRLSQPDIEDKSFSPRKARRSARVNFPRNEEEIPKPPGSPKLVGKVLGLEINEKDLKELEPQRSLRSGHKFGAKFTDEPFMEQLRNVSDPREPKPEIELPPPCKFQLVTKKQKRHKRRPSVQSLRIKKQHEQDRRIPGLDESIPSSTKLDPPALRTRSKSPLKRSLKEILDTEEFTSSKRRSSRRLRSTSGNQSENQSESERGRKL